MSFHRVIRIVFVAAICCAVIQCNRTSAQDPDYRITAVYSDKDGHTNEVGLGNRLTVQVSNASSLIAFAGQKKIILFLNNIPVNGIYAETRNESTNANLLQFYLTRNEASKPAWASLLGHPQLIDTFLGHKMDADTGTGNRQVTVALGLEDSPSRIITSNTGTIQLIVVKRIPLWWFAGLLIVVTIILFALAKWGGMLRDPGPEPPGKRKPYSLVQVQMAFWFLLGGGAFIFIWMITGVYDSLTTQVLTLMGLGCATALGTHVQNAQKKNPDANAVAALFKRKDDLTNQSLATTVASDLKDLKDKIDAVDTQLRNILPNSEGFWNDILTDADGISFHRFQMAAWTVLLGIIFVVEVWRSLAMPEFSDTLMALMGISSGTFVGFMMTEPHSSQMSS